MKNQIELAAKNAALTKLVKDWSELVTAADGLAESKIKLVNLGRKIGICIQELCGHNQVNFTFFNSLAGQLPPTLTFEAAKKCVKLANSMPEPAKTLDDANRAEQLLLEATGMSDCPKRLEQHTSRDVAPATFFFSAFAEIREKVSKKIVGWSDWDDDTRDGVRREVERAEKWIAEVKGAMQ